MNEPYLSYNDPDGLEEVQDYECHPSCPIRELGEQSGVRKSRGRTKHIGDVTKNTHIYHAHASASEYDIEQSTGNASRYFTNLHPLDELQAPWLYTSKASRSERNKGLDVPLMRLRSDLTPEQREYVMQELAKI